MKYFSKLLVSVENKCELTVRDEHLIFQQKNFCVQKLSDLEISLRDILIFNFVFLARFSVHVVTCTFDLTV